VEEILQKELDKKVAQLAEARGEQVKASEALEAARGKILQAKGVRLQVALRGATSEQWSEQHLWELSLQRKVEIAEIRLRERETSVERCRQELLKARSDVDRVATILKRMEAARQQKEAHDERKAEDESAAIRAASQATQWRSVGAKTPER
jgi:flagellar biosynthesis chaperone FliJ